MKPWACLLIPGLALAACTEPEAVEEALFSPRYGSIDTRLLEADLVNFIVVMEGARDNADVAAFADCAAAQYTLIRGYGFARHLRTNVTQEGGLWRGDAVYTISAELPQGLKTIDAEVKVAECADAGIPRV